MSGFPAPRLGRAVRLFTPVVLAGSLTVPLFAGAHENQGNKHRWPAKPAVAPEATTTATEPSASTALAAPAAPVADDSGSVEQQTPTTETAPTAAAAVQAAAVDRSGADSANDATEDVSQSADDAQLPQAPGFVAGSDDRGDDRGRGKSKSKGKDNGRGHAYGRDKGQDRGHHNGHDKGDDHGHGKGGDSSSGDKAQSAPTPAAAAVPAAPAVQNLSPSLAGLAKQVLNPRVCTSRRAVTIRLDRGYQVRAARVLLNGRLIRVVRHGKKVTSTINLRSRARGTYTVRTVVVTTGNKIRIGTRKYTTCAVTKKH
jgi:hypothetical protein